MITLSHHLAAILILFILFIGGLGGFRLKGHLVSRTASRIWKKAVIRGLQERSDN